MMSTILPDRGVTVCRQDKLLHVMALLKLNTVKRRVLLFVNSIEHAFKLKLFLEAFGLRSTVVNAEQPMNSRHHILQVSICSEQQISTATNSIVALKTD